MLVYIIYIKHIDSNDKIMFMYILIYDMIEIKVI